MTAILKLKVKELDDQFVDKLRHEYAGADLEIHVLDETTDVAAFSETDFWQLIARLEGSGNTEAAVIAPVVQTLQEQPLANIYRFTDILAEKLWQLDTRLHAQVFLEDPEEEGYLSVDDFLYARCAVVAGGKAFYEEVLKNPDEMPVDLTFESLLNIPVLAYQYKTGKSQMAPPAYNYETYSNKAGWAE